VSIQTLSVERVEQEIHAGQRVSMTREKLRVGDLAVVRKYTRPGGPKVVLVHGFAQNRYTWHGTTRSFSAWLADLGFDVWNLELRGHGGSRGEGSPPTFEVYVDDAAAVAAALDEPAFWVGHSLGGAVVYAAATRMPVRGVVGLGALFRFAQANKALNLLCRLSTTLRGQRVLGALTVRTRLAGQLLGRLYSISDVAGYAFPISGWAPGSIEPDLLAERLERGFDWTSLQVWLTMARWGSTGEFDYEVAWSKTDVPLLVVAGDLDHLMLPEDARVAYDVSGSSDRTLVVLDDYSTGHHWGHLDLIIGRAAPEHSWPLLRDWMQAR